MDRPRILLVPSMTELNWAIRPLLEEWAEVASYDPPGVGGEPSVQGPLLDAIADRGLAELEARRWDRWSSQQTSKAVSPRSRSHRVPAVG